MKHLKAKYEGVMGKLFSQNLHVCFRTLSPRLIPGNSVVFPGMIPGNSVVFSEMILGISFVFPSLFPRHNIVASEVLRQIDSGNGG